MTEGDKACTGAQAPSGDGAGMSLRLNTPDPEALVIARDMRERLQPAEIILLGSGPSASTATTPTWTSWPWP